MRGRYRVVVHSPLPRPAPLPLSPERIRAWRQCPHAYWHRYIRRSPEERPFSRALHRGSCLHKMLHDCFRHHAQHGAFPAQLGPVARKHLPRYLYPDREWYDRDGRDCVRAVRRYLDSGPDRDAPAMRTVGCECAYTYTSEAAPAFALTARADRVLRGPEGLRILDYKSGAAKQYDLFQVASLHLCAAASSRIPADVRPIRVVAVFLAPHCVETETYGLDDAELGDYRDRIHGIAAAIRAASGDETRCVPTPGLHCRYCPFAALCPLDPDDRESCH